MTHSVLDDESQILTVESISEDLLNSFLSANNNMAKNEKAKLEKFQSNRKDCLSEVERQDC